MIRPDHPMGSAGKHAVAREMYPDVNAPLSHRLLMGPGRASLQCAKPSQRHNVSRSQD